MTVIEFAIVMPVALMLTLGLISACYLFYQSSALHDGASAGARVASFESSLWQPGSGQYTGEFCESGSPGTIEAAVAQATPALTVNSGLLCGTSSQPSQLTQTSVSDSVSITVTCGGSKGCSAPTTVQVTLSYTAHGLAPPMSFNYPMTATSQVPILVP